MGEQGLRVSSQKTAHGESISSPPSQGSLSAAFPACTAWDVKRPEDRQLPLADSSKSKGEGGWVTSGPSMRVDDRLGVSVLPCSTRDCAWGMVAPQPLFLGVHPPSILLAPIFQKGIKKEEGSNPKRE